MSTGHRQPASVEVRPYVATQSPLWWDTPAVAIIAVVTPITPALPIIAVVTAVAIIIAAVTATFLVSF